jgi:hypothetical protein
MVTHHVDACRRCPYSVDVDSIAAWRGEHKTAARSGAHLVHDALLLFPLGTTYQGTCKQYWIGEVQGSYVCILVCR